MIYFALFTMPNILNYHEIFQLTAIWWWNATHCS